MKKTIKKLIKKIFYINIIKILYKMNSNKILNLKYKYLLYLSEQDKKSFKKIKDNIESKIINNISKLNKIKVGFVLYSASNWSCDSLYKLLSSNSKYDPYIIICKSADEDDEIAQKNYISTTKYFKENNYKICTINNNSKEKINTFNILFYMTPFQLEPKLLNIQNIKMNILTVYITYSFMIASRDWKYNMPMYKLVWKYFADSKIYKDLIGKHCEVGNDNVVFCGYTRMDELISKKNIDDKKIWKIPKSKKKVYKIIYAPHHSVFDEKAGFSTFDLNYKFMLELAKKYSDCTSWIIKPHPQLASRIVKNGFFKSVDDYYEYLKEWDNLPNARVVTEGTYFDLFKSSDTMILDSVSFLVEYQYVHKPLLFLTRDSQKFNEFGNCLIDILYKTNGADFKGIEEYLNRIIFNNDDYMKEKRESFFEKNLDYVKYNDGKNASEYIYSYMNEILIKKDDANETK